MLRYGVNLYCKSFPSFPYATLGVNVFGSFCMGAITAAVLRWPVSEPVRLFLTTGVLGGFTTFSAFALESSQLPPETALLNVLLNVGLSLLAVVLGLWLFKP
jgi:CrcB protein